MNQHPVKFIDNRDEIRELWTANRDRFDAVVSSGMLITGEETRRAEQSLASLTGMPHVVLLNSCSDALMLALMAANLQPGDKVLLPAFSFLATMNAVTNLGLKPVFVDCSERGNGFDLEKLDATLTKNADIRAAIAVHLYGHPFVAEVFSILHDHGVAVIEDAAQWFTSRNPYPVTYGHRQICYSFDTTKNFYSIGTLGAFVTDNEQLYRRVLALRNQGQAESCLGHGINSKPNEIQACYLNLLLDRFDDRLSKHEHTVSLLQKAADRAGMLHVGPTLAGSFSTYNKFVLLDRRRNELQKILRLAGIETKIHYPYTLPSVLQITGEFGNAEKLSQQALSLPSHLSVDEAVCEHIFQTLATV